MCAWKKKNVVGFEREWKRRNQFFIKNSAKPAEKLVNFIQNMHGAKIKKYTHEAKAKHTFTGAMNFYFLH